MMISQPITLPASNIGGRWSPSQKSVGVRSPLLVCLHGGGYTHRYFDVPGASMMEAAHAGGFDVFAVDRPDHGSSARLHKGEDLLLRNARVLCRAVEELLQTQETASREVVLVGHSIGAAIAVCMAAQAPPWLSGIAISGVGLVPSPSSARMWRLLPPLRKIPMPTFAVFGKLFGPTGSYDPALARRSLALALTQPVRQELVEISTWWPRQLPEIAAKVVVPVNTALAEFDALWRTDAPSVAAFGRLFSNAPGVVSDVVKGAGHCIDHHLAGPAFQERQLRFARQCLERRQAVAP